MTPPPAPIGRSATIAQDPNPRKTNSPAASKETNSKMKPWQVIPKLEFGINFGSNGSRDGHLFDGSFGKIGDFLNKHLGLGILTNVNGGKVQFRFGGLLNWDIQTGNVLTFGSTFHHATVGPVAELNFRKGWENITGKNWSPLGYLGLGIGLGFGRGTGTLNDGLIYTQNGLASYFNLYLNIFNFSIGKTQVGLNFDYRNTHIRGSGEAHGNWPVANGIGFTLDVQPSVKKLIRLVPHPVCDQARGNIPALAADVARLKRENAKFFLKVENLRSYLENLPQDPFTSKNIKKSLILGFVAEALYQKLGGKNIKVKDLIKIQNGIKAAKDVPAGKETAILAKATGLPEKTVHAFYQEAQEKAKSMKAFWSLPHDVPISEKALAHALDQANDPDCRNIEDLLARLADWKYRLGRRNAALEQQYRRAVHLAGLVLGDTKIGEILRATFLRIDTPNYVTGNPDAQQLAALKSAASGKSPTHPGTIAEFIKIASSIRGYKGRKKVFLLTAFEAKKLKDVANWMNGKGKLPGEKRHEQFLASKGLAPKRDPKEVKTAYRNWVKTLKVMVVGHTDKRGKKAFNDGLSTRRAEYIKYAMVFFGVDPNRIRAYGAGSGWPVVPEPPGNRDHPSRMKNRRVEFNPDGRDPLSTGLDRSKLNEPKEAPPEKRPPTRKKAKGGKLRRKKVPAFETP